MTSLKRTLFSALALSSLLSACAASPGTGGPGDCQGGKCDIFDTPDEEVPATPCDGIMEDFSGRGLEKIAGRLNDPVAKLVFQAGDTCPTTFQDIMAKLKAADKANCRSESSR